MSDNFEHKIQEKLASFLLEPSPEVWQGIEPELEKKRKKRFAFWWWIMPAALLGGMSYYLFPINQKSLLKEVKNEPSKIYIEPIKIDNKNIIPQTQIVNSIKKVTSINKRIINLKEEKNSIQISLKDEKSPFPNTIKVLPTNEKLQLVPDQSFANQERNVVDTFTKTADLVVENNEKEIVVKSENETVIKLYKDTIKSNDETIKNTSKGLPTKKLKFQLTGSYGINHFSNSTFINSGSLEDKSALTNTVGIGAGFPPTPTVATTNRTTIELPQVGKTFSIGILAEKFINNTFQFKTGLVYRFRTNNSQVGRDSLSGAITYFFTGSNTTYKNNSHQLEIPLQLVTTLNPKSKTKISLITGVVANLNLSNNYLIHDYSLQKYYVNKAFNNSLQFNIQTGFQFGFRDKLNLQLLFTQGLTPIHYTASKNYFGNVDAMISIPLKSIKNKTKKS